MALRHSGRLELTWTNKDKTLLAHEDGSYEWVDPADYRVNEVRLLHEIGTVGDDQSDNLLIRGDALHALTALNRLHHIAMKYAGRVKLVYIDPPFNTGQAFTQYDDALEHSVWLTMFRDRLRQIKPLLSKDGSVWVHLDNAESHRARVVMDEEFGFANHLANVVWQRTSAKSLAKNTLGTMHETMLVYGASEAATLDAAFLQMDQDYIDRRFSNHDERGQYDTGDLTATSHRPHLDSGKPWRGFDPSAIRRCWAPSSKPLLEIGYTPADLEKLTIREKLDALDSSSYIHWPNKEGGFPRFKKYLHAARGRAIGDLWTDITVINSQAAERTGFSTQKPEALLQRVLQIATAPGDIVLDCFAGSGTTAAVAHKMGRRWVSSEWSAQTVADFTLPRLTKIVAGEDHGGITSVEIPVREGLPDKVKPGAAKAAALVLDALAKAGHLDELKNVDSAGISELVKALRAADKTTKETLWSGGGGFAVADVGPSMFELVAGRVYLADWASNGALAQAVAAQLGYDFEVDEPFSGTKGKTRLAVVDGLVNEDVIRLLIDALPVGQKLCVCGTAIDPAALRTAFTRPPSLSHTTRGGDPGRAARNASQSTCDLLV